MDRSSIPSRNPLGVCWLAPPSHLSVNKLVVTDQDGDRVLLDQINVEMRAGESLGIVGASGSGKTLLGRSIVRHLPKSVCMKSGNIQLTPADSGDTLDCKRPPQVVMAPQIGASALPPLSCPLHLVRDVLQWTHTMPENDAVETAKDILMQVGLDRSTGVWRKRSHQLSGGMAARAALAAAIATAPSILVLDEPTNNLDTLTRKAVIELLLKINRNMGIGMILLSHDIRMVAQICSRVIVLEMGKVVATGEPVTLARSESKGYIKRLFGPLSDKVHVSKDVEKQESE